MTSKEEPPRAISLQGPNFPETYHGAVTGTTEAQNPTLGEQNLQAPIEEESSYECQDTYPSYSRNRD